MSRHEKMNTFNRVVGDLGTYGDILRERIRTEITVPRKIRKVDSFIKRAQRKGFGITETQEGIVDATDQVASVLSKPAFIDGKSAERFAKSDGNLDISTESAPTAIRRLTLIKNHCVKSRELSRKVEKQARESMINFIKGLMSDEDDED